MAFQAEPSQLDSGKATEVVQNFLLGHLLEGLTRYGKQGEPVAGIAKSWKIDGTGAIFTLRKDALWSDGKPVTAEDFVYAWRRVVDPATASPYASILYPVKNAEAISQGKAKPEELGVSAPNATTLKVTFERPCPYFLSLTSFATYLPARKDFVEKQGARYGADVATLLFNGPYRLTEWVHGASLKLSKNPTYWNAKAIQVEQLEVPFITPDASARFNLFKDGKIDLVTLAGAPEIERAQADRMKIQSFTPGEVTFIRFNHREGRPTANLHLRKAIVAITDAGELARKVIAIPGTQPGRGLVPGSIRGASGSFRKEYPLPELKPDLALAKKELELAKKDLGGSIPQLVILASDAARAGREAEYFQAQLKKHLGIDARIEKQIFKIVIAKQFAGEFDLALSSWFGDFQDPLAYLTILLSTDKNNRGKWVNAEYDRLVAQAQTLSDPKKRMDAFAQAEKLALEDAAVLPKSESVEVYVQNPKLKGVVRRGMGPDPDFVYAQ